jgi:cytochrome c oxidase cbb3-type subunit 2
MRTGPDLANIGARQPSREWHYLHLYNPHITSPGSIMPEFPFLFEVLENPQRIPNRAVRLPEKWADEPTWILPKDRAIRLVEYLLSLDRNYPVPEAP